MFRKLKNGIKKAFRTVNAINSTMSVQCVVPDKCGLRFTTACDKCKKNIGEHKDKIFYEPK